MSEILTDRVYVAMIGGLRCVFKVDEDHRVMILGPPFGCLKFREWAEVGRPESFTCEDVEESRLLGGKGIEKSNAGVVRFDGVRWGNFSCIIEGDNLCGGRAFFTFGRAVVEHSADEPLISNVEDM